MLDQVLQWFGLEPDYDLNLMMPNQTLAGFASRALAALSDLFEQVRPDVVHRSHPGSPRAQARRWGVVSTLKAPDWGFLQDIESGESVFVHASNCIGPVLRQGQRVEGLDLARYYQDVIDRRVRHEQFTPAVVDQPA